MRTVIIANGDPPTASDISRHLRDGDRLLCADGGARSALRFGLKPLRVIGDFDSLSESELLLLEYGGAQLERHPSHKDETDLELALTYAAQTDPGGEIIILGGLGGRLDQTVANVMLLAMPMLRDRRVMIAAGKEQSFLIRAGAPFELQGHAGDIVSLIPFGGDAHGIVTDGLEYALHDESLVIGPARGVSNVMLGERATITLRQGLLLCVQATH
ncbi:MAG TPA: thiamine diphosphokinase [Anaerolineae bacterium]|jgi:thiamine pyrophosphokinase